MLGLDLVQAYIDVISAHEEEYFEDGDTGLSYDLIYIDEDDTPELVLGKTGFWVSVFSYADGELHTIVDAWSYGAMGIPGYSYIPKENVIYGRDADGAGSVVYEFYDKIGKNHELESYYNDTLEKRYDVEADEYRWFYYGDKEITQEEYDSYRKEGDYEEIIGSVSASTILAYLEAVRLPH